MKEAAARERLIIALDMGEEESVRQVTTALGHTIQWVKVGMELYYSVGKPVVQTLLDKKYQVFLDLKFHDIPNTVAGASRAATRMGVGMFNVHAAGGSLMMRSAKEASLQEAQKLGLKPPVVLGVTVLTSMDLQTFQREMGFSRSIREQVIRWALMAREAGLDGVVASAQEAAAIREHCGPDFLIVTPGIRPAGSAPDDQSRIMTPDTALKAGADYLVVGRPVTRAANPAGAVREMLEEMASSLAGGAARYSS